MPTFASRAGEKLDHALNEFQIDITGFTCADFGSSVGGFVDCLLQHDAKKSMLLRQAMESLHGS